MMGQFFYMALARAAHQEEVRVGAKVGLEVDLALAHDGTGPKLLQAWEGQQGKMHDGHRLLLTVDHAFPAPTPQERAFQKKFAEFAKAQGCVLYNHGEGVLHQVVAERASLQAGTIIAGADGHVTTAGAYGALAFALTAEELIPVLTSGKLELEIPEQLVIELAGDLPLGVLARDVAFYLIWRLGLELKGKAVAFTGDFIRKLSAAGRMALCNILPEAGVLTAFVVPANEEAGPVNYRFDVSGIEAMLAVPPKPTNIRPAKELSGEKINVAIAGGCSAGRLEDIEVMAEVLREKPVHPDVTFIITPASQAVATAMDEKGISALLRQSGAVIMPPGCGPCPGKHFGVLASGDKAITTTVRNTPGRIGAIDAEIYLASPLTVAQAAVRGTI